METSISEKLDKSIKAIRHYDSWEGKENVHIAANILDQASCILDAALKHKLGEKPLENLESEARQTAAMCIRLCELICEKPEPKYKVGDVVGRHGLPVRFEVIEVKHFDWEGN